MAHLLQLPQAALTRDPFAQGPSPPPLWPLCFFEPTELPLGGLFFFPSLQREFSHAQLP
jgi:hypothetical protein